MFIIQMFTRRYILCDSKLHSNCNHGYRWGVTLVTWVVVAEVTFSAVMVSGDTTDSLAWVPAFTYSTGHKRRVIHTWRDTLRAHTHTHTHTYNLNLLWVANSFCSQMLTLNFHDLIIIRYFYINHFRLLLNADHKQTARVGQWGDGLRNRLFQTLTRPCWTFFFHFNTNQEDMK